MSDDEIETWQLREKRNGFHDRNEATAMICFGLALLGGGSDKVRFESFLKGERGKPQPERIPTEEEQIARFAMVDAYISGKGG